jgi:hypothetical protein
MHNHSNDDCITLKTRLMIRGLPSLARLALGPSGLWYRSCSTTTWCTSPSAPQSPPSGTRVQLPFGRSTRGCNTRLKLTIFNLINYKQHMTTMKSMVGHIHLNRHIWYNLSIKVIFLWCFIIILLYNDCVHISCKQNNLAFTNSKGLIFLILK